jgi:Uma2 family endonuclease
MSNVTSVPLTDLAEEELYPSRDGQPMAETDLHGDEMTELKLMLRRHFRSQADQVHVGCNSFIYYEQGNPRAVFSPDVFVVRGAPQRQRDTYKLWLDGPAPCFVIEVTSKSTRVEDKGNKKAVCEMLGVTEYFLYDPRAEYLSPPLQGFRLLAGTYQPVPIDDRGTLHAETLGLTLSLDMRGLLVLHNAESGERLLRVDEERERAQAEKERSQAEKERAQTELDEARRRAERAERQLAEALERLQSGKPGTRTRK